VVNKRDALVAEMQDIVRMAAEPRPPVDSSKGAINRAARALGITYRRARSFWYGHTEKVLVRDAEAARLRAEHRRLLLLRIERLEREIAETRRLLDDAARQRDAEAQRLARQAAVMAGGEIGAGGTAECQA